MSPPTNSALFWIYRLRVLMTTLLFGDLGGGVQRVSLFLFILLNLLVLVVALSIYDVAVLMLRTAPSDTTLEQRPPRLPEFESFSVAFLYAFGLCVGLVYQTRRMFSWYRVGYLLTAIVLTPISADAFSAARLGELFLSTIGGGVLGALLFLYCAATMSPIIDTTRAERDRQLLDQVGIPQ